MEGKRVLVAGGGTGIGRGIGLEFAREGAAVVFHYAHSSTGASSAVEQACPQRYSRERYCSGAVEVENYYKALPDFDPQAEDRNIPAGFVGQPRDIARVAVFLASEDAPYIVGQTLIVE